MRFVAIDVETANADVGSICQIGLATFVDGKVVDEWSTLVDPEDEFDGINISIHGIEPHMVEGQPTFPRLAAKVRRYMNGAISVCHTHFDRIAIDRVFDKYALEPVHTTWLDTARVTRRTWAEMAWKGYGLAKVCQHIGYKFKHHDALEDAKACGHVMVAAIRESNLDLDNWLQRVNQPIDLTKAAEPISRSGNPDGDLFGEVVVFTGALQLARRDAAELAASIGCEVCEIVNKRTTILVVGTQDQAKLAGFKKSRKHRRAEELVREGQSIRVIREKDFQALVRKANPLR
jgi:DNA polymerase-3 subunit epsilon